MAYTAPESFFSIAGKDAVSGDIIIKAVNAGAAPCVASIALLGTQTVNPIADVYVLSAANLDAENSFNKPLEYTPQHTQVNNVAQKFEILFKPYSINVLRIHTK